MIEWQNISARKFKRTFYTTYFLGHFPQCLWHFCKFC